MPKPHNVMEDLVDIVLKDIIKAKEVQEGIAPCTCEQCINDVKALTLNELQPRYVSISDNQLKAKIISWETQHRVEITKLLTKAFKRVKENPRH